MAERVIIRSYRRVFEVDRRIYRVDRWALPVPGGVPLRGGRLLRRGAAGWCSCSGALPGLGELVGRAVAAAAVRGGAAGGRGAGDAGGAGRPHGAPLRARTGCGCGCGRGGARRAAWCRSRASRCAGTASWRCAGTRDAAQLHPRRVRGPARVTFRVPVGCSTAAGRLVARADGRARRGQAVVLCAGHGAGGAAMTRVPAALRASEHPRRRTATRGRRCSASTRCPIRSWRRRTSASGCGGWRGSRSRSRPTSRCGASAAPTRPSGYAEQAEALLDARHQAPAAWRSYLHGHEAHLRELRSFVPEVYLAVSLARRDAAGRSLRGAGPGAPAGRGAVRGRAPRCRSPASEIEALIVAEERAFRRAGGVPAGAARDDPRAAVAAAPRRVPRRRRAGAG